MSHHHGHDHSDHDHGDHTHDHVHDHSDETEPALQTLIWKQIDFDNIRTLNENEPGAGVKVVKKTWQQRMEADPELESDADEQLLIFVPYVAAVASTGLDALTTPSQLCRRPKATRHPHPRLHLRLLSQDPESLPQQRRSRLLHRLRPRAYADSHRLADQRCPRAAGEAG